GPPGSVGGEIGIITTGPVTIDKSGTTNGVIDVSATTQAGVITITAGGPLALNGRLNADAPTGNGVGGFITSRTTGTSSDVTTNVGSLISVTGGTLSAGAGDIIVAAGGSVNLNGTVDVSGSVGGDLMISAATDVNVRDLVCNGTGDGG